MNALSSYSRLLEVHPIKTKSLTTFIIFAFGDVLCQKLESSLEKDPARKQKFNYIRTLRQATFGLVITPYLHWQFSILIPRLFPAGSSLPVLKSVCWDQTVNAVLINSFFFLFIGVISNEGVTKSCDNLRNLIWPTLIANWKLWPLAQTVNFLFVPIPFRVLWINIVCMFWSSYLSFVNARAKNKLH